MLLHCDETRSQERNRALAFERLQALVDQAAEPPGERPEAPPPTAHARRQRSTLGKPAETARAGGNLPWHVTIERPSTSAGTTMPSGWEPAHLDLRGVLRAPLRASDLMGPKVASKLPSREEILKGKF